MGCLPISLLTRLCPWQPQGGTLLFDLPFELNHSWTSSAASNVSREGMGPLESDCASLDGVGCECDGLPSHQLCWARASEMGRTLRLPRAQG